VAVWRQIEHGEMRIFRALQLNLDVIADGVALVAASQARVRRIERRLLFEPFEGRPLLHDISTTTLSLRSPDARAGPGALASRSVTSALAMGAPGGLLALHLRVGGGHHIAEQLDRNDFDAFLVGLLKLAKNLVVDDALARPWSIRLEMTEQETLDMDLVVTVWRRRLLAAMPRIREDDRVTGLSLVDLLPKPRRACPCSHRH
jgi:hypothetical protein